MKKLIISSLVATTLIATIVPTTAVFAKESNDDRSTILVEKQQSYLTNELKNKADAYISIENGIFILSEDGLAALTNDEVAIVNNYLLQSNQMVAEAIATNDNELVQQGNEFVQYSNEQGKNFQLMRASSKGGVTLNYTAWGLQIQFSHNAVKELDSYVLGLGGITGALAKNKMQAFLAKKGLSVASKWLGPVGLASAAVVWGMSKIDKGRGVNLNCILYVPATITAR
jgi:hypothetical protein